jgi:hypothetical protein
MEALKPKKNKHIYSIFIVLVVMSIAFYSTCTIFIIAPIGAIPEGKTIIISRMPNTHFIDSADAMCGRIQGGVSLLCRGVFMSSVANNADIYMRLPYSEALYLISTNGLHYDK